MINWELLKHPLNWLIVVLMLVIAGAAGHLVLTHFGAECSGPGVSTAGIFPVGPSRNDVAAMTLE